MAQSTDDGWQKIEEMRITIEDLEALKELNDELEENHVETEKALQEEIGWLTSIPYSLSTNHRVQMRRIYRFTSNLVRSKVSRRHARISRAPLSNSESLSSRSRRMHALPCFNDPTLIGVF